MSSSATRARTRLDAWRQQGANRLDPVRFHFMEALERRTAFHAGEARRLLDARLATLLDAYETDLGCATRPGPDIDLPAGDFTPSRSVLGVLVDHLAAGDARTGSAAPPAPKALEEFRQLWARLRTDSQMRQSLQQVPANAGPLNAGALVHRAITLMRELSPGYLQHFLGYVDDLAWLEQIDVGVPSVTPDTPQATSSRKRTRAKPRRRQD